MTVAATTELAGLKIIHSGQHSYQVERPLGAGGMGQVLLVTALGKSERLALKFLHAGMMSKTRIDAFKREFRLLAEVHHPHVCRVHDFGFSPLQGQYFFTAEYVEGVDLYRAMLQAPLDAIERVLAQVISALDFIHGLGLIHFDVKGANVIAARSLDGWHAKLVDFGVTSPIDQPIKEIAGTLNYMAPELFEPQPTIDQRVDLYSLGIVCYRLLTGLYPYELRTIDEAREWHLTQKVDFEPLRSRGIPDYLVQMTQRLLAPKPEERFSSAAVVLNFLTMHTGRADGALLPQAQAHQTEGPFIGRDAALTSFQHGLAMTLKVAASEQTMAPEEYGQCFVVTGARGLGKSRLLKEWKRAAQIADCTTWLVHAGRSGQDLFDFLTAVGIPPEQVPPSPEAAADCLYTATGKQPTCYLIDNIERAAPGVQKMVSQLIARLYSEALTKTAHPIVVVVTHAGEPDYVFPASQSTRTLELKALARTDVARYIRQLFGQLDHVAALEEAVWKFSNGIPLLMVEAARHCLDDQGALPASIEELYLQRVNALEPKARQMLELLAFSQHPLTRKELLRLNGESAEGCYAMLHTMNLVYLEGGGEEAHQTVRPATGALAQIVLKALLPETRRTIADLLFAWVRDRPDFRARDAAPYAPYVSDHAAGAELLAQAAREAETQGDTEGAIHLIEHRVTLLTALQTPHTELAPLRRKIATLRLLQGKFQLCEEILQAIVAEQGTAEGEDLKMLGLVKRAQRQPHEAGVLYEQAIALLPQDPTNPTFLFLRNERAQAWLEEGAVERAHEWYRETHEWTKQLPTEQQRLVTNNNLGLALARLGRFDDAVAFYHEKLAAHAQDKRLTASIYGQMGVLFLHAGRSDEALQAFLESWQRSVEIGTIHNALALLDNIITLLQKKAAYSDALTYAQQRFQLKATGSSEVDVASNMMTVATLYLNLGVADLAARYLTQAMRLARKAKSYQLLGWIQITFGYLYKDLGRLMEALNAFEETINIGEQYQDEGLLRWGCYGAIDLLVENGEIEEANPIVQRLGPLMAHETDPEFQTRHAILMQKFAVITQQRPEDGIGATLAGLADRCASESWCELHWEIEYLRGIYYHKREEIESAMAHLSAAYEIITKMAAGLGEEYREHFLKQRSRARVLADLKTIRRLVEGGTSVAQPRGDNGATAALAPAQPPANETTAARPRAGAADGDATGPLPSIPQVTLPHVRTGPATMTHTSIHFMPDKTLASYETEILQAALAHYEGHLEKVAASLGVSLEVLLRKLEEHGIR